MGEQAEQHQKWWQKNKRLLIRTAIVIIVVFAFFALLIYIFGWDWTGFNGGYSKITIHTPAKDTELPPARTLWDWLGLIAALAIPVVVGFGAAWFTTQQGKVSAAENTDNQRETALQAYLDKMSELLLEKHLRTSQPEDEVRTIARVRTIAILFQLDARRIGYVFAFLHEAGLMSATSDSIISLSQANLSKINLSQVILGKVDLSGANLSQALQLHF